MCCKWLSWGLGLTLNILALGCPGSATISTNGTNKKTVQIKGRVVDFETCLSQKGCQGAANVRVTLFKYWKSNTSPFAITLANGSFTLTNIPHKIQDYLYLSDAIASGSQYLTVLQAQLLSIEDNDIYSIEAFILKKQGGLYQKIMGEANISIHDHALYLGQIFRVEDGRMKALTDAAAVTTPNSTIRYINCMPTFEQCKNEPALFQDRETTGAFGQFLVQSSSEGQHTISCQAENYHIKELTVPLGKGYLAIGIHQAAFNSTVSNNP
jgi:hypothetical protein